MNKKTNKIHQKAIRFMYKDEVSLSFGDLLKN